MLRKSLLDAGKKILGPGGAPAMLLMPARDYARGAVRKGSRRKVAKAAPPAMSDPWEEVQDHATGQSYWWNVQTNETTSLGAPKPQPGGDMQPGGGALAQQQQQQPRSMMDGLGSVVAQGFAFGAGNAMAHRAVGSLMGGSSGYGYHGGEAGGAPPAPGMEAPPAPPPPDTSGGGGGFFGGEMDDLDADDGGGGWFDGGFDGFDGE